MIEIKNIYKKFGDNLVLDDISFSVEDSEFVAIMGSSGSGKSTLLYSISGMDKVDSGSIIFDSRDLNTLKDEELEYIRLSKMGFVFQKPYLLKNLCVLDNIMYPALKLKRESKKDIEIIANELLSSLGIDDIKCSSPNNLSGGQYQRVAIARALINSPKVLFADEPTGALNSKMSKSVMEIFKNINDNNTMIIMVTHDMNAAAYANRVIFLKDGKIMSDTKNTDNISENIKNISSIMEKLEV
ncbi:putative ABC transport system ATP-binding protein [Peptoniphilus olsenii]|uniref:ABC transport system ATP-binding protein n=1 Tax=Peptoniphilus olsenii TaxID=411570 RepID=A0ABV2JC68_9FIRM